MKCLVSKGFKYLVALFIILSCVSVRAMAKETNDTADQSNRITEKGNTSKDETFDTNDELMSNDPKKSISSQDSASDKGKNEASSTKDSVKTEYTFENSKIKVKAVLKKADAVSDQAELKVKEIPENTTEYKKYENALNKKDNVYSNVLLYDISFMLNGKEVEPADGSVKVSMTFKKQQLTKELNIKNENDLKIIHFVDNNVNKQETLKPTTNVDSSTTTFSLKSFSVVGLNNVDESNLGIPDESFDFKNLLGNAINYGIVTDHFILDSGDAQSNVAAKLARCKTQTGNDLTNAEEQSFILAKVDEMFKIKGNPAYVQVPVGDASKVSHESSNKLFIDSSKTKEELEQDVQDMENILKKGSLQLASHSDNALIKLSDSKYVVDLTRYKDGTYYVTLNKQMMRQIAEADKLVINKKPGQTIVFNVPDEVPEKFSWETTQPTSFDLHKFKINDKSSDSYLGKDDAGTAQTIIWNMPKAKSVNFKGSVTGIVLAPEATVKVDGTSSGWLYAQTVNIGSGEWHNVYQHVVPVRRTDSISLKATKNIDGSAATVSGFKFDLDEYNNNSWKAIQTQENYDSTIQFDRIVYNGDDFSEGESSHEYIYRIKEKETSNEYNYDKTTYYVKVNVTKTKVNEKGIDIIKYTALTPAYYKSFNKGVLSDEYIGRPVFNNTTKTKTTELKLKKIDADSRSSLSGAKFTLYKASLSDGLIKKGDKFGEEITSEPNGLATFADLDYNTTYLLVETQAPNGYKTNGPWAVQIDSNGKTTLTKVNAVESNENSFRVTNDTISKELGYTDPFEISDKKIEYTLPSTGGNGTKALYMIGTLLSILGVIYVVLKKGKGGFFSEKKNL